MENETKIDDVILNWSKKDIDQLINIDGVSIWWVYKAFINFFPGYFVSLSDVKRRFNRKKITFVENVLMSLFSFFLRKFIKTTTYLKIFISKIKWDKKAYLYHNTSKILENNVLSLTYTNHINFQNGNLKIFRLDGILKLIEDDPKLSNLEVIVDPMTEVCFKKLLKFEKLIYNYININDIRLAKKKAKKLYEIWNSIPINVKKNSLSVGENSLWFFIKNHLNFVYSKDMIFQVVLFSEVFKKIILKNDVKSIILTSENGFFEKCAMIAAKKFNIAVIVIQHGFGLGTIPIESINSTKFAIFGNSHKERVIKAGVKSKEIYETGAVIFDDTFEFIGEQNNGENISEKNNSEKTVLIATSPFIEDALLKKETYFRRITKVLECIEKIKKVNIVIKLHPREKYFNEYKKIIKKKGYHNVIIHGRELTGKNFYKLIKECDSFVHFYSQSSIEAMILDKPVVSINILGNSALMQSTIDWFKKEEIGVFTEYNGNIKYFVEKALKNEEKFKINRKKFINNFCGKIDGKASKRVIELIHNSYKDL